MKQAHSTDAYLSKEDRDSLKQYFKEIKDYEPLSTEQEAKLAQRIQNGDQEARNLLVKSNLKFVVTIAKQYQHISQTLELSDLIGYGTIGLAMAADKFDGAQGYRFISYAVWWIREQILQGLANTGRTIRLPMNQVGLIGKINKTINAFEVEHGRRPSEGEIADILNLVDKDVEIALKASNTRSISIDTSYSEEDDSTFLDTFDASKESSTEHLSSKSPDSGLIDESLVNEIQKLFSIIQPIEQYVIGHTYGIGYKEMTLEEIAKDLDYSTEKVQQIKDRGLRHIRERAKSKVLKKLLTNLIENK